MSLYNKSLPIRLFRVCVWFVAMVSKTLAPIFTLQFLELYGAGLTMPVFLYFALKELRLSASQSGAILSAFSAAQLLGAPVVGRLSDAYGRRPFLVACFAWTSLWFAATSAVHSFEGLLVTRTLAGLSGGTIPIVQAMVLDCTPKVARPSTFGILGGLQGLAFTLGPAVAVAVYTYHPPFDRRYMFIAASMHAFIACLVALVVVEETLPPSQRRSLRTWSLERPSMTTAEYLRSALDVCTARLAGIWLARFGVSFALAALVSTYPFITRDAFGWGDERLGMALVSAGTIGAIVQLWSYPIMSLAVGKHTVFLLGALMAVLGVMAMPVASLELHSVKMHLTLGFIFVCGAALMDPGIPDLASLHSPSQRTGLVQGVLTAFRSLAQVVAPLVAGRLYDLSAGCVYYVSASAVVLAACAVAFAASRSEEALDLRPVVFDKVAGRLEAGEAAALLQKH